MDIRDVPCGASHQSTVRNSCSIENGAGCGLLFSIRKDKALYKLRGGRSETLGELSASTSCFVEERFEEGRTPSGKVSEQRIFPYLNAPACRISQMQMKPVYFIKSQCVYLLLHKFFGEEMAGNIEHKTTISKTRSILYFNGCDGIARARRGKQL